jgi:hypothetical protein
VKGILLLASAVSLALVCLACLSIPETRYGGIGGLVVILLLLPKAIPIAIFIIVLLAIVTHQS